MVLRITESYHRGPGTLIPHVPTSTYWYFNTSVLIEKIQNDWNLLDNRSIKMLV